MLNDSADSDQVGTSSNARLAGTTHGSVLNNSPSASSNLSAVSVKPSAFWKNNPDLWFGHLEAQFELAGITQDRTKYYTVVSALDESIVRVISDVVSSPPASAKYNKIKEVLITRLAGSESQKLRQLLTELTLGDAQPSQLLREMRALSGSKISDSALQSLWLQRLPSHMQAILACNPGSLDDLAACADKISEVNFRPEVNSVSEVRSNSSDVERLTKQVADLTKLVQQSLKSNSGSARSRSFSRNRSKSNSRDNSKSNFCWYHSRYGSKARKCIAPCTFSQKLNVSTTN